MAFLTVLRSAQTTRSARHAAALTALLASAAAPSAEADSIAFIQDGNVKLASPDGAAVVPVTTGGGFSSVSQSDDGKLLALRGQRFVLLDRWGAELADFSPIAPGTAGSITLTGPSNPVISPDGTRVAYGFYVQYKSGDPNCGKPGGCQVGQIYTGTGYSHATRATDWSEPGYRPQYSWTDPSWIDNERTLLSGPTSAFVKSSAIDTAGDPADAAEWFSEGSVGNLFDGEMNRQGSAAAFVGNTQGDKLLVYRMPGAAPAQPQGCLAAPAQGAAWSSPTWAPGGEQLAWAGKEGIYVAALSGIGQGCPDAAAITVNAFAPGASSPDWGPAGLPGPKPSTPSAGTPGTGTPGAGEQPKGGGQPAAVRITASSRSKALRSGLTVQVRCGGAGRLRGTARLGSVSVGSGSARCKAGSATLKIRFTSAGKRRLRAKRHPVIRVNVAGIGTATITL